MNHKLNQKDFESKIKTKFPNSLFTIIEYSGASKPIVYKCNKCGKEYQLDRANRLYERKFLCSCEEINENSILREKIQEFFSSTSQFVLLEWDLKTNHNMKIKCLKCNEIFYKKPGNCHLMKEETFCPYCGKNGSPVSEVELKRRMILSEKIDYKVIEYKKWTQSMKLEHLKCHRQFSVLPFNFLHSRGCPYCFKQISKGEQKIINFLQNNNISFDYQKKFEDLGQKSFDFYLPGNNLLIEYNGEQHYRPLSCFGGEEKFKFQQKRDLEKKEFVKEKGIDLLVISYLDFNNIENILSFLVGSTTKVGEAPEKRNENDIVSSCAKTQAAKAK